MKVAILTQPLHTNYGGTLQAYALQKVLINLGHEPETINYRSKIKRPLFIRVVLSKIKRIVLCRKITFDFTTQDRINIRKHHQSFIDTRLNYSEEINGTEGLRDYILKNNYGAVIIGSDQTWRPIYSPRIDSFFLDFLSDVNDIKKWHMQHLLVLINGSSRSHKLIYLNCYFQNLTMFQLESPQESNYVVKNLV